MAGRQGEADPFGPQAAHSAEAQEAAITDLPGDPWMPGPPDISRGVSPEVANVIGDWARQQNAEPDPWACGAGTPEPGMSTDPAHREGQGYAEREAGS